MLSHLGFVPPLTEPCCCALVHLVSHQPQLSSFALSHLGLRATPGLCCCAPVHFGFTPTLTKQPSTVSPRPLCQSPNCADVCQFTSA